MTKLTETKKAVLATAANRPDGSIQPLPEQIKGGAAMKVIAGLTNLDLITDTTGNNDWQINDQGYRAIGMEPPQAEQTVELHVSPAPEMTPDSDADEPEAEPIPAEPETEPIPAEPETEPIPAEPETDTPETMPPAEEALQDDFHDFMEMEPEIAIGPPENADPVFANIIVKHFPAMPRENWPMIRDALEEAYTLGHTDARKRQTITRENSKQARMIKMMQRPEGANIDQIAEETGWNHNTIRGAISGALKQRLGLTIATERVKNVGPNAKGGHTLYRIAEG